MSLISPSSARRVASLYRQPCGSSEDFQLFRDQPDHTCIRNQHKGKKIPSVHVLGDFNLKILIGQTDLTNCETQFTTLINDWAKILENGGQVDNSF